MINNIAVNNASFTSEVAAYSGVDATTGKPIVNATSTLGVIPQFAAGPDGPVATGASTGLAAFAPKGDVVKIAIPLVDTTKNLSMSVDGITMGHSTASFGSFAMNDIKLQGTTVYIWAH